MTSTTQTSVSAPTTAFDVADFLSQLVQVPSCDPPGGELAVARIVHETLLSLGVESTLDEFQPDRANVLGRVRGAGRRKSFVLSSHMDTLPPGNVGWSRDPFSGLIENGRIHGRGTTDMKCALAAMVAAAAQVKASGQPLEGDLVLAFTAGESANLLGARRFAAQGLKDEIGAFLCGEPSGLDIIIVEKAVLWLRLTTHGRMGHVSGEGGVNAIYAMMDCIAQIKEFPLDFLPAHPLLDAPTISVNQIWGGSSANSTPDRCAVDVDIRLPPGVAPETVLERVRGYLDPAIEIEVIEFKPAVEEQPGSPFVDLCSSVCTKVTGRAPEILGVSYYSDGTVLMDGVDAPFAIIGAGDNGGSGTPDESVSVEKLRQSVEIYRDVALAWLA